VKLRGSSAQLTLVLSLLVLSAVVFGAGTGETGSPETVTNLKILWWGSQARHDHTLRVLDLYNSMNPQVEFDPVFVDWNGYWDALYVMAAAEEMPDVFQTVIERLPLFHQKGLLADLAGVEHLDLEGVDPDILDLGRVDGELVAVCLGLNALTLGYNRRLFDEAGVPAPTPFWRWRDLREASLDLRSALGIFGLNGFGTDNDFRYWVRSRGGQLFSEDLRSVGWRSEDDVYDFYEQMLMFQSEGVVPPAENWVEEQIEEENSLFGLQRAAMRIMWSNRVVSVHRRRDLMIGLARLPGLGSRLGMFLRPAMFFSVAADSEEREEAGKFVSYFVLDRDANRILGAERGVPVVESIRQVVTAASDEQTQAVFYYIDGISRWSTPMARRFPAAEAEYRDAYNGLTRDVSFGRIAARDAPELLRARAEQLLAGERGTP
jgi:multiple sugar transport system substrate-binding protein